MTQKAVTSDALSGGGKLHPAKLNSELLEDWRREAVRVHKIKDVATYDPKGVRDAVLRDDFRIVLAWYAQLRRGRQVPHDRATLVRLLTAIMKEAIRRGPDVMRFHPKGMTEGARELFDEVAREVGVPRRMLKALQIDRELEPSELATPELLELHDALHLLFRREEFSQDAVQDMSIEDIVNLHARTVDGLVTRGKAHPAPPDDGLDGASDPFEMEVQKREFARVRPSGKREGPDITLEEVLKHFQTFKLRKPYVLLVGGLANNGHTEGDIDILVKDSELLPQEFRHALEFRIGRALPPELAKRVSVHYDNFHGPFTNHVPLYDLALDAYPQHEVVEMRAEQLVARDDVYKMAAATAEEEEQ